MPPTKEQVLAGQSVYTKGVLSAYDIIVLGISNSFIWNCPSSKIVEHYNANITSNHLDVGVGTGFFLDRCIFPSYPPRVALMDMNTNTLEFASKRIVRYSPETYQQNILEKIDSAIEAFDSVGVNYLFHCMSGAITEKVMALDHLKTVTNPGACIFGSTILHGDVPKGWMAQKLMVLYNKQGIFTNMEDSLEELETALSLRLEDVSLEVVGCVALFSGHVK